MGSSIYNNSRCIDPTAKTAIDNADKSIYADKKAMEFMALVHKMARAVGYKITDRVMFIDLLTGKEYR